MATIAQQFSTHSNILGGMLVDRNHVCTAWKSIRFFECIGNFFHQYPLGVNFFYEWTVDDYVGHDFSNSIQIGSLAN